MRYRIFLKSSGELLRVVDCLPEHIEHQYDPLLETCQVEVTPLVGQITVVLGQPQSNAIE